MAVSGGIHEYFPEGENLTYTCSAAVVAGNLVESTGDRRVAPAPAASLKCQGVALQTGSAAEDKVSVAHDGVWPLVASGAIAAGDFVECAAAGQVRTLVTVDVAGSLSPRAIVGRAVQAIANGATGPIKLML